MNHDITFAVSRETARYVFEALATSGVAYVNFTEQPKPRARHRLQDAPELEIKQRRVILAALPDSNEMMVAMEGGGCVFFDSTIHVNPFKFIGGGFQLEAANAIVSLLYAVATVRRDQPQLTHHSRS